MCIRDRDPDSLIQLPWRPEVGWLASDLWMDGKQVEASPRVGLKRQIEKAAKQGYRMKTGVECEYLSLIHISEPTRRTPISYAVFCLAIWASSLAIPFIPSPSLVH